MLQDLSGMLGGHLEKLLSYIADNHLRTISNLVCFLCDRGREVDLKLPESTVAQSEKSPSTTTRMCRFVKNIYVSINSIYFKFMQQLPMRGSRNFLCWGGGGGGSVQAQRPENSLDNGFF